MPRLDTERVNFVSVFLICFSNFSLSFYYFSLGIKVNTLTISMKKKRNAYCLLYLKNKRACFKTISNPSETIHWSIKPESIELNEIPVFGQKSE